jgi:hypothetical protein
VAAKCAVRGDFVGQADTLLVIVYQGQGRLRSPKGVGIAPIEGAAELLEREPNLQSDLIALNLAILDRTAHLRDFEPAEIS